MTWCDNAQLYLFFLRTRTMNTMERFHITALFVIFSETNKHQNIERLTRPVTNKHQNLTRFGQPIVRVKKRAWMVMVAPVKAE